MTEYICPDCSKNFGNKKDHLERHKNRKNPCVKIFLSMPENKLSNSIIAQNPPKFSIKKSIISDSYEKNNEIKNNEQHSSSTH